MASSVTIGALRYDIIADTEQFERTMTASAQEIRQQKKVFRETQTPAEKYGAAIDRLNNLRRKGLIDAKQYRRALQQEAQSYKDATSGASRFAQGLGGVESQLRSLAGPLLAIASAGGIGRMVFGQLEIIDQLEVTAEKLGVTSNELIVMRLAAEELSKMSATTFDMALQRMTRRVAEAAQGTGEAVKAIEELGLSAERLAGMGPSRAFAMIADAMQDVENRGDQLRLSFKLFDSEGAALVNVLGEGSEALREFQREAQNAGLLLSNETKASIEETNAELRRLKREFEGLKRELTTIAAPPAARGAGFLREWARDWRKALAGEDLIGEDLLQDMMAPGEFERQFRLDKALAEATQGLFTGRNEGVFDLGRILGESMAAGMAEEIDDVMKAAGFVGNLWDDWANKGVRAAEEVEAAAVKARKEAMEDYADQMGDIFEQAGRWWKQQRQEFLKDRLQDARDELREFDKEARRDFGMGQVGAGGPGSSAEYQFFVNRQRQEKEAQERNRLHRETQAKRDQLIGKMEAVEEEIKRLRTEPLFEGR